jgi:hypothetical protein
MVHHPEANSLLHYPLLGHSRLAVEGDLPHGFHEVSRKAVVDWNPLLHVLHGSSITFFAAECNSACNLSFVALF